MYVPSNMPKYVCKACRNKIPITDLDSVFHEQLKNFFFSPNEIADQFSRTDEEIAEKERLLAVLEAEHRKLSSEVDKIYALYQSDRIDADEFGARRAPKAKRQKQLDDEIPRIMAELDLMRIDEISRQEIIAEARDLYTRWPDLPRDEKRSIVEAIVDRINVGSADIDINLLYLPEKISGTNQHEARRIGDAMIGARHRDLAVFQRLAQRIQHPRIELRQFVEKQHALMRQRDFAGLGAHAAARQRGHAGGMMGAAERPSRRERAAFDLAGDGCDHRYFEQFRH